MIVIAPAGDYTSTAIKTCRTHVVMETAKSGNQVKQYCISGTMKKVCEKLEHT